MMIAIYAKIERINNVLKVCWPCLYFRKHFGPPHFKHHPQFFNLYWATF